VKKAPGRKRGLLRWVRVCVDLLTLRFPSCIQDRTAVSVLFLSELGFVGLEDGLGLRTNQKAPLLFTFWSKLDFGVRYYGQTDNPSPSLNPTKSFARKKSSARKRRIWDLLHFRIWGARRASFESEFRHPAKILSTPLIESTSGRIDYACYTQGKRRSCNRFRRILA
jgi:hypothetical protein